MSRRRSSFHRISRSSRNHSSERLSGNRVLTYFRSLTPIVKNANISVRFKTRRKVAQRDSSFKVARLRSLENLKRIHQDFQQWRSLADNFESLNKEKVCHERKERRECIFAFGKQGGNHKPPTYTLKSIVRCR